MRLLPQFIASDGLFYRQSGPLNFNLILINFNSLGDSGLEGGREGQSQRRGSQGREG